MLKKLALLAIAASTMALALPAEQATARSRGGVFIHSGGPVHFRAHRFRHSSFAPIYAYSYYNSSYYDNDCYWLKRRAINTGSPYWWRRYRACRDW